MTEAERTWHAQHDHARKVLDARWHRSVKPRVRVKVRGRE